jgi:hypothetical protein
MVLFLVRVYRVANRPSWKDLLFVPRSSPASSPSFLQHGDSGVSGQTQEALDCCRQLALPFLEAVEGTCVSVV